MGRKCCITRPKDERDLVKMRFIILLARKYLSDFFSLEDNSFKENTSELLVVPRPPPSVHQPGFSCKALPGQRCGPPF